MSTAEGFESGPKVEISGPQFWQRVELHYAGNGKSVKSQLRWRRLAMFHLYSACGWTCEMLASAFGVERCNVSRQMAALKKHFEQMFTNENRLSEGQLIRHSAEREEQPDPMDDDEDET